MCIISALAHLIIVGMVSAEQIGIIYNASLIPENTNMVIQKSSCNQCLCFMLNTTGNDSVVSFNCHSNQANNVTCTLFKASSYLNMSWVQMVSNTSSRFYFRQLPTVNQMATTAQTPPETTTAIQFVDQSFWPFDGDFFDVYSNIPGNDINQPTFVSPGITGYGSALSLNATEIQYVNSSKYYDLANSSFTIEMWIYPMGLESSDYGLFSQLQSLSTYLDLHCLIRNHTLYMGFWAADSRGVTRLNNNTWYHVAFVYDYLLQQQIIYLNGMQDAIGNSKAPLLITNRSVSIGLSITSFNLDTFNGLIDQVYLTKRAKNSTEILDDATLVTWQAFDGSFTDSSINGINGTGVNVNIVPGRINQALNFSTNFSYYQMDGFVLLGVRNSPFSFALWIRPYSIGGATLINVQSNTSTYTWCLDMMGLSSSGEIVAASWNGTTYEVVGPVLPTNTWTHVVSTYSLSNGIRLYVNGTFVGTTNSTSYKASRKACLLTLGYHMSPAFCGKISIVGDPFSGDLDEFRVYSRELTAADIMKLAS